MGRSILLLTTLQNYSQALNLPTQKRLLSYSVPRYNNILFPFSYKIYSKVSKGHFASPPLLTLHMLPHHYANATEGIN